MNPSAVTVLDLAKDVAGYVVLGLLALVGWLWKQGYFPFASQKAALDSAKRPVTKGEFEEAMAKLNTRLDEVAAESHEAKTIAEASAQALHQSATLMETTLKNLTERFDRAIDRLDGVAERMVERQEDHNTRLSRAEAGVEQQQKLIQLLLQNLSQGG